MSAPARAAAMGDNRQPLITANQLAIDFAHVEKFVAELEAKAREIAPVVEDDEDLAAVNEIVPKLRAGAKRCDEVRDEHKRPYLDAGNVVHIYFKALENRLLTLKASLEARGTRYLQKKADAERARQAEIERHQREEAEKLAREAAEALRNNKNDEWKTLGEAAKGWLDKAAEAAAAAAAKPADLARTRTSAGTATLLERYEPVVEDYMKVDLKAIQVFIKTEEIMGALKAYAIRYKDEIKTGTAKIQGVKFVAMSKASFR